MWERARLLFQQNAISVAVLVLLLAACLPSIASADFWWHLRTGQFIHETHTVPRTDPFSFTAAGHPWIAHEWLSELILYLAHHGGGFAGVFLLFGAATTAAFWLALRRAGRVTPWRLLALALAVWAARPTFLVRPQAFSLLLFAIFLVVLDDYRRNDSARSLFFLPPLTLLWVNLHGGYVLGPGLIVLAIAGSLLDAVPDRTARPQVKKQVSQLMATALACLLVVPLNPNGARMYRYPFETLGSHTMQTRLMEWLPPDIHQHLFYPFFLLLGGSVIAVLLQRKRLRPSELLLFTVFAVAALHSMRYLSLFAIVSVPVLSAALPPRELTRPWNASKMLRVAALLFASLLSAWRSQNVISSVGEVEKARFPAAAVSFLQQRHLSGQVFNAYSFGGYIIWRLYPEYRVYVDGRADVYGDAFLERFIELYEGQVDPRPEFDRLGIRTVIVEPGAQVGALLGMSRGWQKVYEDRVAVIFTR